MSSGIPDTIIRNAANCVLAVTDRHRSLDDALDACPVQVRRTVSHILFNYFRHRKFLDGLLAVRLKNPPRPPVYALLRAALTQAFFQHAIAPEAAVNIAVGAAPFNSTGLVNAVLRGIVEKRYAVPNAPEEVLPDLLLAAWRRRFTPDELAEQTEVLLGEAPFAFRMLRDFPPPEDAEALPGWGDFRFFSAPAPGTLLRSEAFRRGEIYIQDPATSLAPSLPDYTQVNSALDLCAAPGGKTLMLAERLRPGVKFVAADRSRKRQDRTRANCDKYNIPAVVITAEPHELDESFDLVLADVPCGNSGVFRRRPDAMWRYSPERQKELAELQRSILDEAARLVLPGGQLVYSTCSIEPEENDDNVAAFLKDHAEFRLLKSRLLLPSHVNDGAFAALMVRRSGGE